MVVPASKPCGENPGIWAPGPHRFMTSMKLSLDGFLLRQCSDVSTYANIHSMSQSVPTVLTTVRLSLTVASRAIASRTIVAQCLPGVVDLQRGSSVRGTPAGFRSRPSLERSSDNVKLRGDLLLQTRPQYPQILASPAHSTSAGDSFLAIHLQT